MSNSVSLFDNPVGLPLDIHGCWEDTKPRPIWEQSTWDKLKQTYQSVVGNQSTMTLTSTTSFAVPYEILYVEGKGRGVFSKSELKMGDLVWSDGETASFTGKDELHKFLSLLPFELACDILQWAYVYDINKDNENLAKDLKASVDLGEGSLMNDDDDPTVIECNSTLKEINGCEIGSGALYASRDLQPGVEITTKYKSFHKDGLLYFDDLSWCAWDYDCRSINVSDGLKLFDKPVGLPLDIHGCWEDTKPRPIWEQSTWDKLRQAYHSVVRSQSTMTLTSTTSFAVPYEILDVEGKGRSVFTKSELKMGDLVWSGGITASFPGKDELHKFLSLLPFELACDILQWAYVYDINMGNENLAKDLKASVDLDEGSLINDDDDPTVIECNSTLKEINGCEIGSGALYASRDLQPGVEITTKYNSFHVAEQLLFFDELVECAWYSNCRAQNKNAEL